MIKISPAQKGNNVIEYLSRLSWQYDDHITIDYEINHSVGILFLSLRFHSCKPDYIYKRIKKAKDYRLGILLVNIDVPNYNKLLRELYTTTSLTIILAFSSEECARYIQGFDLAGSRSIDVIRCKGTSYSTFLTSFSKINKSDASELIKSHSNLQCLFKQSEQSLSDVIGIGKSKSVSFRELLERPFK